MSARARRRPFGMPARGTRGDLSWRGCSGTSSRSRSSRRLSTGSSGTASAPSSRRASCRRSSSTRAATRRRRSPRRRPTASGQIGDAAREVVRHRRGRRPPRRSGALEAGPDPKLPAETLVDEPGGLLRSPGSGVSAAMVSRQRGLVAEARRDLAATRRLEAPFVVLGLGPADLSALSIRTASGVLRVVPGLDLKPGGRPSSIRRSGFRATRPRRSRTEPGGPGRRPSSGHACTKTRTPETGTSCRPSRS